MVGNARWSLAPQAQGLNLGGADPNAAYQMPRLPWGQKDAVTLAAFGLLGGRTLNEGIQNAAQMVPAGLAADTAKRRDMYSIQETNAARARRTAAFNAGIKKMSGVTLTPQDEADLAADPEVGMKIFELTQKQADPFAVAKGASVYIPGQGYVDPPAGSAAAQPDPGDASQFRKEIVARPAYQKVAEAEPIYRSMVETYPRKTRVSDLNLVYGLAKIMDPGSVVKEGEQIAVKNSASLPDWVLGQINWVNGKNELQDATRQGILTEAKSRMDAYQTEWQHEREYWEGAAGRGGFAREDIPSFAPLPELPFKISNDPYPVPPDPNL